MKIINIYVDEMKTCFRFEDMFIYKIYFFKNSKILDKHIQMN